MPNLLIKGDTSSEWWFTDGMSRRYCNTAEEAAQHVFAGLARWNNDTKGPFVVPQSMVNFLPIVRGDDKVIAEIEAAHHRTRVWVRDTQTPKIADTVIAKLPPASSGGVTKADVQAACEAAVESQLGFLKPGV